MERWELYSEGLIDESVQAVTDGVDKNWPDLLRRLGASMPDADFASLKSVEQIECLLNSERFLVIPDSWNLLHFILTNWDWFPEESRRTVALSTANAFDHFSSYMGAFVASEILGEKCADRWALERLVALGSSATMPSVSLVPHGLECLARTTSDSQLREGAIEALRRLALSGVTEVKMEAKISLKRFAA